MGCAHSDTQVVERTHADVSSCKERDCNTRSPQAMTLLESPKRHAKTSDGSLLHLESWDRQSVSGMKGWSKTSTQAGANLDVTNIPEKEESTSRRFGEHAGDIEAVPVPQICRRDLTSKGLLGCGGFGKVELVEHNESKETFALKTMSKAYIQIKKCQYHTVNEKRIQMMCNSPFICKLYETYCDFENLYLLLELALGGDVRNRYDTKKLHGNKRHTQFYVAGCVCALQYLHENQIIFRDLKPENMLITSAGHVKLSDFGVAKVTTGKTFTICGTEEYLAPEMLAKVGYTHAVDWWSLGIATFWMMTGQHPFSCKKDILLYRGLSRVKLPIGGDCEAFLKEMCRDDPAARLPMGHGGVKNLQMHPWFKGFDWVGMLNMTLEPPYRPDMMGDTCVANFGVDSSDLPPQLSFQDFDDGTNWFADFATSD